MRTAICLSLAAALACGACTLTAGQQAATTNAVTVAAATGATIDPRVAVAGELFCSLGPTVAAVANVNVTGQTAAYVAAACAAWDPAAVPVPPPAAASVPVVTVTVPAS